MTMKQTWHKNNKGERIVPRLLDLRALLAKKSHFLFGPRQTGKSFWINHTLPGVKLYNLLDYATFLTLSRNPERLSQELTADDRMVVIDEIQRLPILLNEVHALIESKKIKFLLTGSSARKLRRGGVNLLGGRARVRYLHPLTAGELGGAFDLELALNRGLLPAIYFSDEPEEDLKAYAGIYLHEEITAEGATRNVPAFSRFLKMAALCNGKIVNFTNLANDAQVPRTTVYEYFEILKDTLILHEAPAWRKTLKRKPLSASKFYFFDPGVARILQNRRSYSPGTPEFGEAFEAYIFHELISCRDYQAGAPVSYWRSTSGYEVDFILGDHTAIEVKSSANVNLHDLKSLAAISEENIMKRLLCVCLEPCPRKVGDIQILPLHNFLAALWAGEF
jgi:predicted AAA+ superfamily ATPase